MSRRKQRGITAARMLQQERHCLSILFEILDIRRKLFDGDQRPTKEDWIAALVSH